MSLADRDALVALYEATDGASWRRNTNWDTDADLSLWHGVKAVAGRVVSLFLERNNLRGPIPQELGNLDALKCLNLRDNQLTGPIPESLGALSEIKSLWLSSNKLTGHIPPQLGNLRTLRKLHINMNKFEGPIPEALGALIELEELGLNGNELTGPIPKVLANLSGLEQLSLRNNQLSGQIPKELAALSKLEMLWLNNNELTGPIPPELGRLGALVKLEVPNNELSGLIPPELGTLRSLEVLRLVNNKFDGIPMATAEAFKAMPRLRTTTNGNPWKTPSSAVIRGGWDQVLSFYEGLSQSGGEAVPSLKVVLVGATCAGKTTLARGLLDGELARPLPPRTRGVDVHIQQWMPDLTPRLEVAIWDFAGHDDYYSTHQLFLTEGALHLLVVDLSKFDRDPLSRGNSIYVWLDSLLCRVPGSAVLVVGTHADAFTEDDERAAAVLEDLKAAIKSHLETKRQEWLAARRQIERERRSQARSASAGGDVEARPSTDRSESAPPSLQLCGFIALSGRSVDNVAHLGNIIWEVANDSTVFPELRQIIPNNWRRVWAVLDALRTGADPDLAVRLEGAVVAAKGRDKLEFVTQQQALEVWWRAEQKLATLLGGSVEGSEQPPLAATQQFQAALNLRQTGGYVLAACGLVHLNPSWINDLLRELLDHRLADPKEADWWREQLIQYSREHGIRFHRLAETHRRFVATGSLTTDYLGFLWREIVKGVDDVVFRRLVETMAVHDAMFPCDGGVIEGGDGEYMVPARLPCSIAEASLSKLQEMVSRGTRMQFVIEVYAEYVPPTIIAQFLGAFGRDRDDDIGTMVFHTCWARGASFEVNGRECLIRFSEASAEAIPGEVPARPRRTIEINIAGHSRTNASKIGSKIKDSVMDLLEERYPGLLFDTIDHTYMDGTAAWQDIVSALQGDLLEKRDKVLEDVLRKILDNHNEGQTLKDEALTKELSSLRVDIQRDVSFQLESNVRKMVVSVEQLVREYLSGTNAGHGGLGDTNRIILTSVARDLAFLRWPIPRLVCVLPAPESAEKIFREKDRSFTTWSAILEKWCRDGRSQGKKFATRELRLFFLCPQDMSLAECGPRGQGYEVKQLLKWAKKARPVARVGLALASIALKVCTGLSIPTADFEAALGTTAGGALSEYVKEALDSRVEAMSGVARERLEGAGMVEEAQNSDAHSPGQNKVWPKPMEGFAYDQLKEVVKSFEVDGMRKGEFPFPSFTTAMQLVDRGGRAVEWAWVRTRNIDRFVSS